MAPRRPNTTIDRMIAESKQITADLMALRHEMNRRDTARRSIWGNGRSERAYLIYENARHLTDDMFDLWTARKDTSDDDSPVVVERPRLALGNGQRFLTGGR